MHVANVLNCNVTSRVGTHHLVFPSVIMEMKTRLNVMFSVAVVNHGFVIQFCSMQ